MMTNSMKRCESSPLRVVFWTSAIKESDQCSVTSDRLRQYRSEEHTSELQSQSNLVCRLLLEKKKIKLLDQSSSLSFSRLQIYKNRYVQSTPIVLKTDLSSVSNVSSSYSLVPSTHDVIFMYI